LTCRILLWREVRNFAWHRRHAIVRWSHPDSSLPPAGGGWLEMNDELPGDQWRMKEGADWVTARAPNP